MTRMTHTINPAAEWEWEGCIEYADGRFESIWSNPFVGEDEITITEATSEEIARHKAVEEIAGQDTIQAGVVTDVLITS